MVTWTRLDHLDYATDQGFTPWYFFPGSILSLLDGSIRVIPPAPRVWAWDR